MREARQKTCEMERDKWQDCDIKKERKIKGHNKEEKQQKEGTAQHKKISREKG